MTEKLLYGVMDAADVLSLTRTRIYQLINDGSIKSVKDGKRRLIPRSELVKFADKLAKEAGV